MRARNVSRRLTLEDAIRIHKARAEGAAYPTLTTVHQCNLARIAEVLQGKLYPEAKALAFPSPPALNDDSPQAELPLFSSSFGCKVGAGGSGDH